MDVKLNSEEAVIKDLQMESNKVKRHMTRRIHSSSNLSFVGLLDNMQSNRKVSKIMEMTEDSESIK